MLYVSCVECWQKTISVYLEYSAINIINRTILQICN